MELGPILRAMRRNKVRFGLIVLEIALTLAIVANCVTMILEARTQDDAAVRLRRRRTSCCVRSTPVRARLPRGRLPRQRAARGPGGRCARRRACARRPTPASCPGRAAAARPRCAPAGTKGEMLRTQIYTADEATLDTLGVQVTEGRGFTARGDGARHPAPARALRQPSARRAPDGLPRDKFTPGRGHQPRLRQAGLRRGLAARQAAGGLGRRPVPGDRRHRRLLQPLRLAHPRVRGLLRQPPAQLRGRGAATSSAPSPARPRRWPRRWRTRLLAANGGRNVSVRTLDEVKAQYFGRQRIAVHADERGGRPAGARHLARHRRA